MVDDWHPDIDIITVFSPETLAFRLKRAMRTSKDVSRSGVNVTWVRTFGTPFARRIPLALRKYMEQLNNKKIISAMVNDEPAKLIYAKFNSAGIVAREVSRVTGEPYFVDLGESGSLVRGPVQIIEKRKSVMRDASGVICVSPRLRDEAIKLGADPDNVKLMPNAPNSQVFRLSDRSEARRILGVHSDIFLCLYVGRFSNRKGILRVDAALQKMRHRAQVAYLGSGELWPGFDGILFKGSVEHDMLPVWMNAADVLVLPTLAEGCCNVIAEAMACGLPVVSSDIEDIRWQVPADGAVLVDPQDTDAIASVLDDLAENPARLKKMRRALALRAAETTAADRSAQVLRWLAATLGKEV